MLVKLLRRLFKADRETIYSFRLTKEDEESYHLNWPTNSIGLYWYWFKRDLGFKLTLDETDDDVFHLRVAIPFVITLYFHIAKVNWLTRLLGMKWYEGMPLRRYRDLKREIGFSFTEGGVLIYLWVNSDDAGKDDRDVIWIDFKDVMLGRAKYEKSQPKTKTVIVVMPEGGYEATVRLYKATWKRPRWPWPKVVSRAEIEVEGGIPIPCGDHDWDYDMDHDAIFSMTTTARTFHEASIKMYEGVMRDRIRRAAANWKPSNGWPSHCLSRVD